MLDYTIMEYNIDTRKYTPIGVSEGIDGKKAKENYIKRHGWEEREGIYLFESLHFVAKLYGLLVQLVRTPGS